MLVGPGFAYISVLFLVGFLVVQVKSAQKDWLSGAQFLLLILMIPLAYFPNLLSVDDWISSRTMVTSATIVLIYQFVFIRSIVNRTMKRSIAVVVVSLFLFGAYFNQNYALAGLQAKEYKVVSSIVDDLELSSKKRVILRLNKLTASVDFGLLKRTRNDEFGFLSTSIPWVPEPMLLQLLYEKNKDVRGIEIQIVKNGEAIKKAKEDVVINFEEVLKKEFN